MDVQAAAAETAADSQQTCTSVDTGDVSRDDESNVVGTAVATSAGQCKKGRERRKSTPPTAPADTVEGRPKRCGLGELARTSLFINHPVLPELDAAGKPVPRPKVFRVFSAVLVGMGALADTACAARCVPIFSKLSC
jgi:hypothetical protein